MEQDPTAMPPHELFETLSLLSSPRPIGWISTISADGTPNLAPYSFVVPGSVDPPTMLLCVAPDADGEPKDTARNVLDTEAFAHNLVTHDTLAAMAETAGEIDGSEFAAADVDSTACERIDAPRVAGAPAWLECTLREHVRIGENHLFVGDIAYLGVDDRLEIDDGVDPTAVADHVVGHLADEHFAGIELLTPE